jgi:hypothetical protein
VSEEAGETVRGDLDLVERQAARRGEDREEADRESPEGRRHDEGGANDPRCPALPALEVTHHGSDRGAHDDHHHRSHAGHDERHGSRGKSTCDKGSDP